MFKENHYQKKQGKFALFQKAVQLSIALQTAKNLDQLKDSVRKKKKIDFLILDL